MAQAIPDWLLGREITTLQVTAQEKASGVLDTPGGQAAIDFFTTVDEITQSIQVQEEELSPLTSRGINMRVIATGESFVLQEMLRKSVAFPAGDESFNSLALLFRTWEFFLVTFTRAGRSWSGYYGNGGYDEQVRRGKSTGVARFSPITIQEASAGQTFGTVHNATYNAV